MTVYPIKDAAVFAPSHKALDGLVETLRSADGMRMTHDEAERMVDERGREVLRLLYQGYLELRSHREACEPVTGVDGVERNHQRDSHRGLQTVFGGVTVARLAWSQRGVGALHPLDAALNLPTRLFSFGLQQRVCDAALGASFDRSVELVNGWCGGGVAKRQAEQIVVDATQDFDAFYQQTVAVDETAEKLLVLSFDQKGVVMRTDALRPATKKAALASNQKLATRLSKGEKPNRKRMAMVAAVYSLEACPREPGDLVHRLPGEQVTRSPRPRPTNKRVWASLTHSPENIVEQGFQEALDRDPERKRTWVVLVDGSKPQIRLVRKMARRFSVEVTLVLDLVHVIEYLWKAAWAFHNEGDPAAEAWVHKRLAALLQGKASTVAAGMRRSATLRGLTDRSRASVDAAARYLLENRDMVRYHRFLADGLPVATGVIEGACRHLIGDRLDITGARWGLNGAEAILRLRALRASGDFDAYWEFHVAEEMQRNHLALYAEPAVVAPTLAAA